MNAAQKKYEGLLALLRSLGSVAVAFSGGTDSALLLAAAQEALGDKALAVTALSPAFPAWESEEAKAFCRERGIRQVCIPSQAWDSEAFRRNPPERCYVCKKELMAGILAVAEREGCAALAEGSNVDDLGDYRPGLRAIEELGLRSPLREAGLTKAEIRALSKQMGLPTWDKPSCACLASRFPYGEAITEEKLHRVGQGEEYLRALGFGQLRVRCHGNLARLELSEEAFPRLLELRQEIHGHLRALGFAYVALDLGGYRTGSLNEVLGEGKAQGETL